MNKILIATPMLPPTLGGPGIHAAKLCEHFSQADGWSSNLFVFEKLNKYPAGLRHIIAFFQILKRSKGSDIILALDGFSVALPAVFVATLTRKKVVLRIGGDLVHEQYAEKAATDMEDFYNKLGKKQISLSISLRVKLCIQRYVFKNANAIIFTSAWQKNIYTKFYSLPKTTCIIQNPIEELSVEVTQDKPQKKVFLSAARDVAFKNTKMLKKTFSKVSEAQGDIILDTDRSDRDNLLSRMAAARAYINVSLSDISPNTVIDAISLKLPVILTKNTGLYDILKDSGVCRFVDPFDQMDIEKAISEMCDDNIWSTYKSRLEIFKWPQTWETLFLEYEKALSDILK